MNTIYKDIKHTDIYLIDQILKGRFKNITSVLDVGCGKGRNLDYFISQEINVFGLDANQENINWIINNKKIRKENFKTALAEKIPFQEQQFDLIICNAVLHFAKNKTHFEEMLFSIWDRLAKDGILFIRLASNIGIENLVEPIGNGNYQLPDKTQRYLISEQDLINYTAQLNANLIEQLKTTNVQSLRCMTTWILKK